MDDQPTATADPTLTYEETPIMTPIPETTTPPLNVEDPPELPDPLNHPELQSHYDDRPKRSGGGFVKKVLAILILFAVGLGGSIVIRQFLAGGFSLGSTQPEAELPPISETPTEATTSADPFASWKTYQVLTGGTREPIDMISFKLPSDILEPICDGEKCASQGTYLPGGSRFTVAARGKGQLLSDYRGKAISDLTGKIFETTDATVSGKTAIDFMGSFSGTTVGGYAFSRMHGVMIEVTDTLSLEVNHFTPTGLDVDFESDEVLFEQILKNISFESVIEPTISPLISPE